MSEGFSAGGTIALLSVVCRAYSPQLDPSNSSNTHGGLPRLVLIILFNIFPLLLPVSWNHFIFSVNLGQLRFLVAQQLYMSSCFFLVAQQLNVSSCFFFFFSFFSVCHISPNTNSQVQRQTHKSTYKLTRQYWI